MKQAKIVAIGGGEVRKRETLSIDKEIIRLSGKKHPKLLFIPTASSDAEGYWETIKKYFGSLGCRTDVLFLVRKKPSPKETKRKILSADIIYVGGGNTLKMMRLWRRLGVTKPLEIARGKGTVLCGVSAGSICWFDSGHSDSMSFYSPKRWRYIKVKGLGFIKGIHCPHYDSATLGMKRNKKFQEMMRKMGGLGIALDNNCALEMVGDSYRILASKKSAGAYKVFKQKNRVISQPILRTSEFLPLDTLYS